MEIETYVWRLSIVVLIFLFCFRFDFRFFLFFLSYFPLGSCIEGWRE